MYLNTINLVGTIELVFLDIESIYFKIVEWYISTVVLLKFIFKKSIQGLTNSEYDSGNPERNKLNIHVFTRSLY